MKTQIEHRIAVLEAELQDSANNIGKEAGLGNGTILGWTDNQIEKPTAAVEKFLRFWAINPQWWKTGEGDIFLTSVQEGSDNKEKQPVSYEETIEGLINDLRENNQFLKKQFEEIRETNERLRADLRAANDGVLKLATIALTDGKK